MRYTCTKEILIFDLEQVEDIGSKKVLDTEGSFAKFFNGHIYTKDQILEELEFIPDDYFKSLPAITNILSERMEQARLKGNKFSLELLLKATKILIDKPTVEAIVILKQKISSLTRGMNRVGHESLEHGLMWSTRVLYQDLLRELEDV